MRTRWQFDWPLFSHDLSTFFSRRVSRNVSRQVFSQRLCERPFCASLCARALFSQRLCERRLCASFFSPPFFSSLCSRSFCAPLSRSFFWRLSGSLFSWPLYARRLCEPALFSRPVFSRRQLSTVSLSLFWRRRSLFSSAAA